MTLSKEHKEIPDKKTVSDRLGFALTYLSEVK